MTICLSIYPLFFYVTIEIYSKSGGGKMRVYCEGERIYFSDKVATRLGMTNFNNELWEKIRDLNFRVDYKGKYIYCSKLKKTLHQIVMDFYYGESVRKEMYKNKFIIEHHDNDGFNCCVENLSFYPDDKNKSKAFGYDKDRVKMMDIVAMNIFKDFNTQKYQITLAFNKPFLFKWEDKCIELASLYLVYSNDYRIVINDATNILDLIDSNRRVNLAKLNFEKFDYRGIEHVYLTEEEKKSPLIFRDGQVYMNMNCPYQRIVSTPPKKELYNK